MNPSKELEGLRILVVDDDADNAELLSLALERQGGTTVVATTGVEATALLREQAFDAAVLDRGLPDMDGIDVVLHGRQSAHSSFRAFLVTGRRRDPRDPREQAARLSGYFEKPVDFARLASEIAASLAKPVGS